MSSPSTRPVYWAAQRWRERCLLDNLSLFSDDRISTAENADVLIRDFVEQPDLSKDNFLTKLRSQLSASAPDAVRLGAELLYVHLLVARSSTVSGSRKAELVRSVLGFAGGSHDLPAAFESVLQSGLINPGQGYNSYRWRQFGYLIQAFALLKRQPDARRKEALTDPGALIAVLDDLDEQGAAIQRYSLEHLLFPDDFVPVVSREHRQRILNRWADPSDTEKRASFRLATVANDLRPNSVWENQEYVNFYRSPYTWEWSQISERWTAFCSWGDRLVSSVDLVREERTYKLEAAEHLRVVAEMVKKDSPGWQQPLLETLRRTNLLDWRVTDVFAKWLEGASEAADVLSELWTEPGPSSIDRFLAQLPDSAASGTGSRLSLASLLLSAMGAEQFPPWRARVVDTAYRLVSFAKPEPSATNGERYEVYLLLLDQIADGLRRQSTAVADRLDAQGVLWALINYDPPVGWSPEETESFLAWRGGKELKQQNPEKGGTPSHISTSITVEKDLHDVAALLYVDEPFLDNVVQLLTDKKQLILQGPPGTGKTYIARELASWFTGSPKRVRLVQFHASYGYEDFVEGFRPALGGGFELREGPLLEMAKAAAAEPREKFVLVIDELNRGNVARVFGELYFLLEYRDEPTRLLYGKESFRLPPNLFVIGTMNTADRSIAMLDTALRRRFYFVELRPDRAPVSGVLRRYLADRHPQLSWLADVVDAANKRLGNPDAVIGPSHFMRSGLDESQVQRIWDHAVLPTLADYFHGTPDRLADFDLEQLRGEVAKPDDSAPAS